MIRKFAISFLTLLSIGTVLLWWFSVSHAYTQPDRWVCSQSGQGPLEHKGFKVNFDLGDKIGVICSGQFGRLEMLAGWAYCPHSSDATTSGHWHWQKGDFYFSMTRMRNGGLMLTYAYVPFWFLLGVFAAWPVFCFLHGPLRRWHRYRNDRCTQCGYNLTGNVSGDCPECGTKL